MYTVIREFADLLDDGYIYHVGDKYPRKGRKATIARAEELLGAGNKIGEPLIAEEAKEEKPIEPYKKKAKNK